MAILGFNTKGSTQDASQAGRKRVTKVTLASAATLLELHGWFYGSSPFCRYQIVLYADNAGLPGALLAYTAPLTTTNGDCELSQSGFSVALPAGSYWVGHVCESTVSSNGSYQQLSVPGNDRQSINSGSAFNPPSNPFGTPNVSDTDRWSSAWAVTGTPPANPFTTVQFGANLGVTDLGSGVIRVDATGGTPADATTSSKGIIQLAGDLAGTAASPQIAALAVTDAEVAAANKDGVAGTASMRTLGTGAQQAAAGNDSRFLKAAVNYGTTLPASPVDGQEAVLVDSTTNPTYQWRFRYNAGSSSAYKWEFIGGASVRNFIGAAESWTATGTMVDVTTPGPLLVLPRAGDYMVMGAASFFSSVADALYVAIWNGTVAQISPAATGVGAYAANANVNAINAVRANGLASGSDVRLRYQHSAAGTATVFGRWIDVLPVRVS